MKRIEILAPAGGEEALTAAVRTGADAVYLGGEAFGARAAAHNFNREQLKAAVEYCHARDTAVYVTVNTLIKNREFPELINYIEYLCSCGVDSVIIQDIGLYSVISQTAPELRVHASTQMSIHNAAGVRFLESLNISRVVLARELSAKEMQEIAQAADIELEVFIHGALCMSVSGQCYFSAMLGSRSGNRGMCAQTCRLPFSAGEGSGYDLSLKDLSIVDKIAELEKIGIKSLKIEGRMKRPEYVAAAVSACVSQVNGEPLSQEKMDSLSAVFSRSGFTGGYFSGNLGADMFGVRRKEDVAGATQKLMSGLRGLYRGELSKVPVEFSLKHENGEYELTASDTEGRTGKACAEMEETARPIERERLIKQLGKTGGTPFYMDLKGDFIQAGTEVYLSIQSLNKIRRDALEKLLENRKKSKKIPFLKQNAEELKLSLSAENKTNRAIPREAFQLWGFFHELGQIPPNAYKLSKIGLPVSAELQAVVNAGLGPDRTILELPRVFFGKQAEDKLKKQIMAFANAGYNKFACGNLGAVQLCRELGVEVYGTFGLNITNSYAAEFLSKIGLKAVELSYELKSEEISGIASEIPKGLMLYGRQAVMITRNCPVKNRVKCSVCKGVHCLTDRRKVQFPVMCTERRYSQVLNSVPLYLLDKDVAGLGISFGIMRFTVENSVESGGIIDASLQGKAPAVDYTRGLFNRGVL